MSKKNPFVFMGGKDSYMLFGGFLYKNFRQTPSSHTNAEGKLKSEWRCVCSPEVGCNAVVHSNGDHAVSFALHNHPADFEGMEDAVWKYYSRDIAAAAEKADEILIEEPSSSTTTDEPITLPPSSTETAENLVTMQDKETNEVAQLPGPSTMNKIDAVEEKSAPTTAPIAAIEQMLQQTIPQVPAQQRKIETKVVEPPKSSDTAAPPTTQHLPQQTPPYQQMMGQPQIQQRLLPTLTSHLTNPITVQAQTSQKRPQPMGNNEHPAKRPYMPMNTMTTGVMVSPSYGVVVSTQAGPQLMRPPHMLPSQYYRYSMPDPTTSTAMQVNFGQRMQFQQVPQGQMQFGQMIHGQTRPYPPGQVPQRQTTSGQFPPGQVPQGQMQFGQMIHGQMPRQFPPAQGHVQPGQMPLRQYQPGQNPPGQLPNYGPRVPQQAYPRQILTQAIPSPQQILQDPQMAGFRIKLVEQIRAAIVKSENEGYAYKCFPNCERFAYKGYVYHLPTGRTWFCARRTRKGAICTAQLKLSRDPNRFIHQIIAIHDHQKDYAFLLREVCRQLLYNTVADKCDQHIFDKIYHTLRALLPEFLSGKVLPDFDTVKHRVWSNPLRDVDVERVKLHYRKVASKNQSNNPVINLDDDDEQPQSSGSNNTNNLDDPLIPALPFGVLPIYEDIEELEEPDRRPVIHEEMMAMLARSLPNQVPPPQPIPTTQPGPRQMVPTPINNLPPRQAGPRHMVTQQPAHNLPTPQAGPRQVLQRMANVPVSQHGPRQMIPQGPRPMQQGTVPRPQIRPSQPVQNMANAQIRPGTQMRAPIQTPQIVQNPQIRPVVQQVNQNQTMQPSTSSKNASPEVQSSTITLLAYVSDPLFFCVNGISKLAYRGDIYQLSYETPEFTFWHCDRKSCKARLKQVTSNNQFMFFHLCEHQIHMPPVYKINDVPVIRLNVLNPKIETPTFKHFSVPGMTIKKEHIMADVPESILKTASVNVPNRVKPTNTPTQATQNVQKTPPAKVPQTNQNQPKEANAPTQNSQHQQKQIDQNRWKELAKYIQVQYSQILQESNDKPYLYVNGKERRLTYRGQIFANHGATNVNTPHEKTYWFCIYGIPSTSGTSGCSVNIIVSNGKIQFTREISHTHASPMTTLRSELLTFLVVRAATFDQSWTSSDARNVLSNLNQGQVPAETRIGKWIAEQRARGKGFYEQLGFIKASIPPVHNPTTQQTPLFRPPQQSLQPVAQNLIPQNSAIRQALTRKPLEVPAIVGQQAIPRKTGLVSQQQVTHVRNISFNPTIAARAQQEKEVDWEEERWKVTLDFPLLFPASKEDKEHPRMAYKGNVYYKVSAIDEFSLWKCELHKVRSETQSSCRATIEVSRGKVNLIAKHNHQEDFKNMWSKLQESGIDIGVYGVPKSEPISNSRKQRKSNAPTTTKEVIQMDSDSDEIQILTPATTPVARDSPAIASEPTTLVEIASDPIISDSVVEIEQSQIEERIQFMVNLVAKLEGDFRNDDESPETQILQVISSIVEKVAEEEETEEEQEGTENELDNLPITVVQNETIEECSVTENDKDVEISSIEEGQYVDEGQVEDRVEENFAESLIETDQENSPAHGDSIGTNETESEQDKKLINDQEVEKISSSTNLQSSLVDELKVVVQNACEASKRVPMSILLQGREFLAFQGHLYRHKTKAKRANSSTENCTKTWSCIENYRQAEKCLAKLEIIDAHTTETAELTQLQHLFPKFNIPEWSIPESTRTLVVNAVQEHNHDQNMDRTEDSIIRYLVIRKAIENPELSETDMFEALQALTPKTSEQNSSLKASLKAFREELMRLREQGMDIYAGIDHRNQLAMSGTIEKEHKKMERITNQEESGEALRNLEISSQIDSEDRNMVQEHNHGQNMDSNGSNQALDEPINMDTTDTLQLAIAGSDSDIEMES